MLMNSFTQSRCSGCKGEKRQSGTPWVSVIGVIREENRGLTQEGRSERSSQGYDWCTWGHWLTDWSRARRDRGQRAQTFSVFLVVQFVGQVSSLYLREGDSLRHLPCKSSPYEPKTPPGQQEYRKYGVRVSSQLHWSQERIADNNSKRNTFFAQILNQFLKVGGDKFGKIQLAIFSTFLLINISLQFVYLADLVL